jgi:hypothetical protein
MEKAVQTFRDKAKIYLVYQIPYGAKGEKKPIISYNMSTVFLNAATGEPWSPEGYNLPTQADAKPLTDKPLGAKPAANLNLTKEQAIQKVQETVKLPADAKLENASYNENTNPETGEKNATWNLNWSQTPADPTLSALGKIPYFIYATVNSQTGELLNFNHNVPYTDGQSKEIVAKVSQETAKQQAIDFVKKNLPAYTDQLVLDDSILNAIPLDQQKTMRNWDFNFQRIIDGVSAAGERVSISIDKTTGEMVNYNFHFTNTAYPMQKPEVMPLDKAKDLLLSQYNVVLAYTPQNGNMGYGYGGISSQKMNTMIAAGEIPPGPNTDKKSAKLVYMLVPKYTQQAFFLDAVTGQWKDASTGEVIILDKITVSDIEGHWAQNELQLMVDYQALDVVNGQVSPNKVITRGEMIKMLVIAMNGGRVGINNYGMERTASFNDVKNDSPLFAYVENAVDRGLVDRGADFNPKATMNREEMAQLVVRTLGYKNLTKYNAIFNDKFTDAAAIKNIGEVAIVVGLNIMTLTDGSFGSTEAVTRAQAATAFFRYLQKRAELQDGPRYY